MTETKPQLTIAEIDNIYHSMSAKELWQNSKDVIPIEVHYTQEDIARGELIYPLMDATELEYKEIETILFDPKRALLGDIQIYCRALNIDVLEFIEKTLAK
jgi:hypothetical protein